MYEPYQQHDIRLQNRGIFRQLPDVDKKKDVLDFSTNDYLCLAQNAEVLQAACIAGKIYGVGSTGSRLLSGNPFIFEEFESRIALDKNEESALIFNSGFQANVSVLASLLDKYALKARPVVFFDKLNHSSLYQAIFLSGAELVRYKHNNTQHLKDLLKKWEHVNRPKFIVSETLFGMDGDIIDLKEFVSLAKEHQAFLYLDEAHATGVMGKCGYGLSTTTELNDIPHLVMGTFSKALGGSGAYVACHKALKTYLINRAPGFIYSTANSPMVIGAAAKAWEMVELLERERNQLFLLANHLRNTLASSGFNIGASASHIVPVILGKEDAVIRAKEKLWEEGILISNIRPPTVPPGTSRLRIALNISHTQQDIDVLTRAIKRL